MQRVMVPALIDEEFVVVRFAGTLEQFADKLEACVMLAAALRSLMRPRRG